MLNDLYDLLLNAQHYIYYGYPVSGRTIIMRIQQLLEPYKADKFARETIFKLATIRSSLEKHKPLMDEREAMADEIELLIQECTYEMGFKRIA